MRVGRDVPLAILDATAHWPFPLQMALMLAPQLLAMWLLPHWAAIAVVGFLLLPLAVFLVEMIIHVIAHGR